MNEKIAKRIAARIAKLDGIPYPPEVLSVLRQRIAAEELDRYEAQRAARQYSTGLPEQWSELIPEFEVDYSNATAIARGHKLG